MEPTQFTTSLRLFFIARRKHALTDFLARAPYQSMWSRHGSCPVRKHSYRKLKQEATFALAVWLSWLECCPIYQKAAGSIPSWGAYGRQQIDVSLSLPPSLPLSKKSKIISSGEDLKKKKPNC